MTVEQIIEGLSFIPSGNETHILINHGDYKDVMFKFGRVWFPYPDQPVLSFDYDVVSELKPEPRAPFLELIGQILHNMLRKSIEEETTIYAGGVDVAQGVVEEEPTLFQPPVMDSKILTPWSYKLPEPEPGTKMSRNILGGL